MKILKMICVYLLMTIFLIACTTKSIPIFNTNIEDNPVKITGSFTYSNDFVLETYYVEQASALADMHGFVIRDMECITPVESQFI